MRAIAEEAVALVRKYKGAFSGEHGDGLCRGEWIAWQFGPAITDAFAAIKQRARPVRTVQSRPDRRSAAHGRRRAVPLSAADGAARRTARSRSARCSTGRRGTCRTIRPPRASRAPGSGGDATGGFAKAVEMCNNNGHCRKFDAGTMCPSFRVTRDEQHVTRGRANTLRLALSGQLGADAFTSDAMRDAMELCVGCKGCKRECPTGVDMARMKIEFLAHYKRRHGHT